MVIQWLPICSVAILEHVSDTWAGALKRHFRGPSDNHDVRYVFLRWIAVQNTCYFQWKRRGMVRGWLCWLWFFFNIRTLYNTLPPSKDFIQFLPAASVSSGRANTSKLRPALTEWQEDMQNHHTCDVHETATHRFKATQLFVDVLPQKWLLKKSGRIHSESSPTIRTWHVHHNLSMKWSIQVPNDMSGDKWRKLLGGLLAWEVVSGNFPLSF